MKKAQLTILALFLILIGLSSCERPKLSTVQQAAVDTLVSRYEIGSFKWKKVKASENSSPENCFSLELKDCPLANHFPKDKENLIAAMALTLYEQLGSSRKDFEFIQIRLIQDNDYLEMKFETITFEAFYNLLPLHHQTIAQFVSNDLETIYNNTELDDTSFEQMSLEEITIISNTVDSFAGPFHEKCLIDYGFTEVDGQEQRFPVLKSMLKGAQRNLQFRQVFHPITGKTVGIWFKEPEIEG